MNYDTKFYMFFHSTFVCPTEIIAFSDRIKDFDALNTSVVGVSVDSHFSHLAWINTPRKVFFYSKIIFIKFRISHQSDYVFTYKIICFEFQVWRFG